MHRRPLALLLALAAVATTRPLPAQSVTRPFLEWHTLDTKYFEIHYPTEFSEWTWALAERIDAEHDAVSRLVGYAPSERVTVIVDDPFTTSNGFAVPLLDTPLIFLFPTPPQPSDAIGDSRDWPEVLSVHEYAHIAHLTRPSRDPAERQFWRLLPVRFSPMSYRSPRWLIEGYATYVEGKLTGTGRPHGAWRAAILRRWAMEGQMPRYAQLNGSSEYFGGSMAYLAGSAYLEWLVERNGTGDSSLVRLWRRMTARQRRGFDEAFAGIFGDPPDVLYGRFIADLTGKSLAVDRRLGVGHDGAIVQHLSWSTGAPAIAGGDSLIAIELLSRTEPSRVVVWRARERVDSAAARKAAERARALDPEDDPAVATYPRSKRAIATLRHATGYAFTDPRFFADGQRVLLARNVAVGDGTVLPDLFVWNWRTNDVHRVTHGASIRNADPSADGSFAVGERCTGGRCDIVRVDLNGGEVRLIIRGSVTGSYSRPRLSPDGRFIAASVQTGGRWRIALVTIDGGTTRFVDPEDAANRYEPAFFRDGLALAVTSEVGGIANIERIDLATEAVQPLTRVTGAARAPEPSARDGILFLSLHARGYDLRRVSPDSVRIDGALALDGSLAPAISPPVVHADSFARARLAEPHGYGFGPRAWRTLPVGSASASGTFGGLAVSNVDPIGRLDVIAQGIFGDSSTWRGASVSAVWHGTRPSAQVEGFYARERPSAQRDLRALGGALDAEYAGGDASLEFRQQYEAQSHTLRFGASGGSLRGPIIGHTTRALGFADYRGSARQSAGGNAIGESLGLSVAGGRTSDRTWVREVAAGSVGIYSTGVGLGVRADGSAGWIGRSAPAYEQLVLGGTRSPLFDAALMSQRFAMPALPVGIAGGRMAATYRAAITGLIVEPFFWSGSAGDRLNRWHRVAGAQGDILLGPFPFVRLPTVRVTAGVGYSFDDPFRYHTRAWASIALRP
ncbi:MAG: hypothetical protein M3081_11490 [Gemmatimonadota bacterium]|nr:hypothetical protein [Gemmatimonadota bacterium]